jgi:hypothetical protein
MKRLLEVCFVALTLAGVTLLVAAQTAGVPMQRGIAVDYPIMHNAVAIPEADKEDAVVVTLTRDGSVYLGIDRTSVAALSPPRRSEMQSPIGTHRLFTLRPTPMSPIPPLSGSWTHCVQPISKDSAY